MNSRDIDRTHVSVGFRISGRRSNVISQVEAVLNSLKAQEKTQERTLLEAAGTAEDASAKPPASSARRRKRERDRERMRKIRALARAAKASQDGEQTLPGTEDAKQQETKR